MNGSLVWTRWLESLSERHTKKSGDQLALSEDAPTFVAEKILEPERPLLAVGDIRQGLAASMSPSDGGELSALSLFDEGQWHELLYRGNNWTKVEGWPGRAAWLWPIAGRCYATQPSHPSECSWSWDGVIRPMDWHGFVRHHRWHPQSVSATHHDAKAEASLSAEACDIDNYPFNFEVATIQQLTSEGLEIKFRVDASPDNSGVMPFTLGFHLCFDFPSWWGKNWLRGTVEGLRSTAWKTNALAQADEQFSLPTAPIHLNHADLSSAIIPAQIDSPVRMICPERNRSLEMSFRTTPAASDNDTVWVTYCDPEERFFCLEPWVGWPNGINSGQGRVDLEPGRTWEFCLKLRIRSNRPPTSCSASGTKSSSVAISR